MGILTKQCLCILYTVSGGIILEKTDFVEREVGEHATKSPPVRAG
jgi:hypothetical protein